jgi:GT2 family glycosyltransferase/glycosyltransferase involved in cell wall biosynthesis
MSETPAFTYFLDHPTVWKPVAPNLEIVGWFYPGTGRECRDIRARIDGKIFLGIYGLERPDVRAAHPQDPNAARTGFMIRTLLWNGAREVTLDYLDATNTWQTFARYDLDSSQLPAGPKPRPLLRAILVYESLFYLYRNYHHRPWREIRRAADAIIAEITLDNSNVTAEGTFRGYLENPGFWIDAKYDKFRITGWVFDAEQKIQQLSGTTVTTTENRLVSGKERADVAAHHPSIPHAIFSNFYGLVDVRTDAPSPVNLRVFANLPDGTRRLAFARRMHLNRFDENTGPIPVYRPLAFARCVAAFSRRAIFGGVAVDSWKICRQEVRRLHGHLTKSLARPADVAPPVAVAKRRDQDPYTRWLWHNRPTPTLRRVLENDLRTFRSPPRISILVPAYNTPEKYLRELLDSVRAQIYPHWELAIADDASPKPHVRKMLEEAAKADARIKPVFRSENGHISRATNSALERATGEFVAFLDHDDLLSPDALFRIAEALQREPRAGMLYTDEDKIDDTGRHFDPQFKGAWSPEMAITHNYTHHLTVMRKDLVAAAGGLRPDFNGAQDIDLILRVVEKLEGRPVVHVPHVCYHWRAHAESTASKGDQKGYLFDAARRAIVEALQRRGHRATTFLPPFAQHYALCLHQLKWDATLLSDSPVTIVIPTRNRVDLLRRCLDSLARTVPLSAARVVIVDDRSDDAEAKAYLASLNSRTDLRCEVISAPAGDHGFDYSALVNLGSARADTPLLLHLNNDVEALQPGWLEDMVGWMSIAGVGVVGAQLLYPDGTINHAGISLSRQDGLPHTLFEHEHPDELGYLFLPHAARNVAAVTGACLLTRTALYRELGGFDADRFKVAYNDVDYCLRVQAAGQRVVVSPQAVLQHIGSATRGKSFTEAEHVAFVEKYAGYRDPFHSDVLDFPPAALQLNPYVHRAARASRPFHALVVTHNLKLEGAPIFIFEYARYLAEQPGVRVTVISPEDGPLRPRFEAAGLPVTIVDVSPLTQSATRPAFDAALKTFAAAHPWPDVDVIVSNTMVTYWAVHLASALGKPSVLYVHESMPVKKFFQTSLPAPLHELVENAYREATRVVFTAKATRTFFEEYNVNDNFRTLPSWVDLERIEAFAHANPKAALRRKHGLDPDKILVVNVGSVCERKGQHVYVRAIDQLNKELTTRYAGRAEIEFLIVGGRAGLYQESLNQDIELLGLKNLRVFNETPDIYDFYRLADVLVCTSFEESFPRVLLEAMGFRLPIVSTDVNGIPEMLVNHDEALLIPAGDPFKLVDALKKALDAVFAGSTKMTSLAYARARRDFGKERSLPRHLAIAREAFLSGAERPATSHAASP